MHKNVILLIVSVSFLFLSPPDAVARGQSEDPIRQARELIAENRINDAILLLEQTVREDPERIQQAEALLRTIREIRGEYNVMFDELIDNLVNNPDDIERTLEIIDRMEALDEFPNERVVEQIEDARVVAQLAFDRNVLQREMDTARELLANGEYVAAIETYVGLRELQRNRFETRGYGDIFVNSVNEVVSTVPEVAIAFRERLPAYQDTGNAIETQARRDIGDLDDATLTAFFGEAAQMIEVRDQAADVAGNIAVLRSQVPLQFPDDPVDWYLNFQEMITRGRSEYRGEEGIVHAIESAYQRSMAPLVNAGRERTVNLVRSGEQEAEIDRYDIAAENYRQAAGSARLWEQAEAAQIGYFGEIPDPDTVVTERTAESAETLMLASGYVVGTESLTELASVMATFVETGGERETTLFSLRSQKDSTNAIVNNLRSGTDGWEEQRTEFETLPEGYTPDELVVLLEDVSTDWTSQTERAIARERELVQAIALAQTEEVPETVASLTEDLAEIAPLVTGVTEVVADAEAEGEEVTRVVRYPDDAQDRYETVEAIAEENLAVVNAAQNEIGEEPEYVVDSEPVAAATQRLAALEQQLVEILADARTGIAETADLIAQSEALVDEAQARVADMRAAIAGLRVAAARNNFQAVREAYFDSLQLREDADFRQEVDAQIRQLGEELQELENVIVVRRVRELLNRANELYGQDQFVSARDTLLEAQQTWEQTNVEDNTEIERLLRLVTAALSLEEGRELAITDPLYPVLSNYLSIARDDYNRGVALYERGEEERGDPLFDRAIENLRNVRDVRPLNWDARILELRMTQIRNEDDFESVFASRYEQAVGRLDEEGPLQVYSELEVLAEINPDYPGLQEQIRQLEIALNLRPDPVDQARRRQAAELYQRAQSLSGGSRDQVSVAVSLLEQAIELDPTNGDASFLLDQLRIQLGGQATVALDTADEQQYRRAETLFIQGQALQALNVVERLLRDAENQNYPPLVDLRRRIGLRLGI